MRPFWTAALLSTCGAAILLIVRKKDRLTTVRRGAAQGDAAAQFNLGLMFEHGHGVPRDCVEAARWYRKAAAQGLSLIHI